jgi:SAM-dependent methyltransferase
MDLTVYRASARERARTEDLLRLVPERGSVALDVGARDGYFSRLLAERFDTVVALDLERPAISHARVECVAGDVSHLQFPNDSFDFVLCAEVLEHVPPDRLSAACSELTRVCRARLLIGVPDEQDLRLGRTTCGSCGFVNPPWGHVNRFDDARLRRLFDGCEVLEVSRVGVSTESTNALSARLMELAGNPYGTYEQEEPCVKCGASLGPPPERGIGARVLTRMAVWSQMLSPKVARACWIHHLLAPTPSGSTPRAEENSSYEH